ncbi:MAG: SAM-dependent methyltransferase [Cyanobacteria bacterium J06638_20]
MHSASDAIRPFNKTAIPKPPGEAIALQTPHLCVEIGAGQGLFAVQFSQTHPDMTLIAIERTQMRFAKLHQRIAHNPCPNVIPIRANAVHWIAHYLSEHSVDAYFILYPNPYPKASQRNKRFHAMPFMGYLIATLKLGGTLTLATNQAFYHAEAKAMLTQVWSLSCVSDRLISNGDRPRTHFEKKYLERGDRCTELVFRRDF